MTDSVDLMCTYLTEEAAEGHIELIDELANPDMVDEANQAFGGPPGADGLRIQSRVNGSLMQDASTADMLFDVAETIALLTECMTLEPGDLIASGTPAGVGYARTPPVWLTPGDTCEVEVEGVGVLSNPVAAEEAVSADAAE